MRNYILNIFLFFLFPIICFGQYDKYLYQYVSIPSLSGNESKAGEYLKKTAEENGLHTQLLHTDSSKNYNLAVSLYDLNQKLPSIIFLNHIDVVPVFDSSLWINNAVPLINDSIILGRGAIDSKGLCMMQLGGLIEYKKTLSRKVPFNVVVLCVSGEEWENENGIKEVIDNYIAFLNPIAVYGEGGGGTKNVFDYDKNKPLFGISVSEKKALWIKISTSTKKNFSHAAIDNNLYANKRLIKGLIKIMDMKRKLIFSKTTKNMFKELSQYEYGFKKLVIKKINWWIFWPFVKKYFKEGGQFHYLAHNTFIISQIKSKQSAINEIATDAEAIIDVRLLPETSTEKYLNKLKSTLGNKFKLEVLYESPNTKFPSITGKYYDLIKNSINQSYRDAAIIPILFPATTDNNYFRNLNIPTYGVIPSIFNETQIKSVHGINEYLYKDQLNKGISVYRTLLENIEKNMIDLNSKVLKN
jgi:carboxypeptidase PM20D1